MHALGDDLGAKRTRGNGSELRGSPASGLCAGGHSVSAGEILDGGSAVAGALPDLGEGEPLPVVEVPELLAGDVVARPAAARAGGWICWCRVVEEKRP